MYSKEDGLIPNTMEQELQTILDKINEIDGTNATMDDYKNSSNYAVGYTIAQRFIEIQNMFSSILQNYKDYIESINTRIKNPINNMVGVIEYFNDNGYDCSFKKVEEDVEESFQNIRTILQGEIGAQEKQEILNNLLAIENGAGNVYLCVKNQNQVEDIQEDKNKIAQLIVDVLDLGNICHGDIEQSVNLSDNQTYLAKWTEPIDKTIYLKLSWKKSNNNKGFDSLTNEELKSLIIENINKYCRLGMDFEPEKILEQYRDNLMYMGEIILEWSTDNVNFSEDILYNTYKEKIITDTDKITIIGEV